MRNTVMSNCLFNKNLFLSWSVVEAWRTANAMSDVKSNKM